MKWLPALLIPFLVGGLPGASYSIVILTKEASPAAAAGVHGSRAGAGETERGRFLDFARDDRVGDARDHVPFPATPTAESCQAEPVAPEQLTRLLATPTAATPVVSGSVPAGAPADEDVTLLVQQVIVEVFACFNAGERLRAYALYSDGYLRHILAGEDRASLAHQATPQPLEFENWTAIVDIRDVRLLADGRVYATVILDPGLIPVQKIFGFFLIDEGGRWLVDDVLDELEFSLP